MAIHRAIETQELKPSHSMPLDHSASNSNEGKLLRFFTTGILSAGAYCVLSYLAQKMLGWTPFTASNAAYMLAFCGSYLLQRNWTFKSALPHLHTLSRYALLQISCSLLTGIVAHLAIQWTPTNLFLAVACATIFAGILSYVLSYIWIFNHDSN